MRLTENPARLAAPLLFCLLNLAGAAQATTQTAAPHEKKAAQAATAKKTAAPTHRDDRNGRVDRTKGGKASSKSPAQRHGAAPKKPAKAVAEATARPALPPEITRKISQLEETNKELDARVGELSRSLALLAQRHDELRTNVDKPPPPPPMPRPEFPATPLVLSGLLGAVLGFLGALAGGLTKGRFLARNRKDESMPFPTHAEPLAMRQEPSVS